MLPQAYSAARGSRKVPIPGALRLPTGRGSSVSAGTGLLQTSSPNFGQYGIAFLKVRKAALFLFLIITVRLLFINGGAVLEHRRQKPNSYFKAYQIGERGVIFRPWRLPFMYKLVDSGLTKQLRRIQPIPELQGGMRPQDYGCNLSRGSSLLFVGIFTTASKKSIRQVLRRYERPSKAIQDRVEIKFVVGRPKNLGELEELGAESKKYGDIILLEQQENMNYGKTYAFYKYLARRPEPMPRFAFKADDDTLLFLPNLLQLLESLDCKKLYYMGSCSDYTCGLNRGYPYFFTGMAYGLSAPLVQWIGNAELSARKLRGVEDVRTAQFLLNLDTKNNEEHLIRLNLDGRMGDWQIWDYREQAFKKRTFDPATVIAIHGLKQESDWRELAESMKLGSDDV